MGAVLDGCEEDLEALFDSIAGARCAEAAGAATRCAPPAAGLAVAGAAVAGARLRAGRRSRNKSGLAVAGAAAAGTALADPYPVFERIGILTRNLHDALKELGYDKQLENAVGTLPDARARLSYIAKLTGQAAETALSKSEAGIDAQNTLAAESARLAAQWDEVFAGRLGVDGFRQHAERTRAFLQGVPARAAATNALFSDIILAQDFHDLTGQVVQKIVSMAERLEAQLVKLLLDTTPPQRRGESDSEWLNGPVIDAGGRDDVVRDQAQVDELLASLGF